ncbi:MAG: efflux RND transporter periplasmic adaptor subunit [Alphaproteobacteria bacterium]|nr:efflux RND transporter periplasmic adaptor subunit [Alphaproteobacteria bacterium]
MISMEAPLRNLTSVSRMKLGVAGLAVVVLGGAAFWLWPSKSTPAQAQSQMVAESAIKTVSIVVAKLTRMAPTLSLPGTVVARNDSKLASEVQGRVAWVAEVGTSVAEGEVIARLDNQVLAMQLASQKANVARLAASLRYNKDQADRMQKLFSSNAIAKSQRDQAVSTRDMTSAELNAAQATLNETRYQYEHSEIRAPFPGRVAARLINAGEYASPGKDIVRLVDIGSIEVKAQAPIDVAHFLKEGASIPIEVQGHKVPATVRAIVPVGDELSRTVEVRLSIAPDSALVGDAAKVFVPSDEPRNVLAVPRDALVLREDSTYLFKVDAKNQAQRVAIETGTEDGAMVEVRGPIKSGDKIVIQGAERLEVGDKVKPKAAT